MIDHLLRSRWELSGPWRLKDEPLDQKDTPPPTGQAGAAPDLDDGNWQQVPPATHLQPWLYPENPYWGAAVRAVNDVAWWYRTHFARPQEGDHGQGKRRFRLAFEAVDYQAQVWLNGHPLGRHEGGFTPFWFDVSDRLQDDNALAVRVTAPWDAMRRRRLTYVDEVVRGMVKGLYAHADGLIPPNVNPIGIWRPVWLEAHADVTIERLSFTVTEDAYDRSAQLTLQLQVANRRPVRLHGVLHVYLAGETMQGVRVNDNYPVEVPPGRQVIEQQVRVPDPHWWWPWDLGRPDLYRLRCTLYDEKGRLDACEQVLGVRQVQLMRSKQALHYQINQVPFFVRGTTYMGGLYLSQLTAEQIEADLDRVQECGLNLIRLHVHVAPPELYAACDRRGILIWQDFELNWVHDCTPAFEERAVGILHETIDLLENHPSIITWCCHNEPGALPFQDRNLRLHPDQRLYKEVRDRDPTRPAFLCSGGREEDWLHSGDTHACTGGGHGGHYMDVYGQRSKLVTEFGCEAPPDQVTLDETPLLAGRLSHVRPHIAEIQAYQAALLKYQIEWYRITRFEPCGGYIQFMLADLYPQVGYGALDVQRRPKAGFAALKSASQPVHAIMEHTASGPVALWAVNDPLRPLLRCLVEWEVTEEGGGVLTRGAAQTDLPAQRAHRVTLLQWKLEPDRSYKVSLRLSQGGQVLDENVYDDPFHPPDRPKGYPWKFDPVLGMKCYGGHHARSLFKVLNTWYGRAATWIFPVYRWAEDMLAGKPNPRLEALLRRLF